jgi:hypothetical protein
MTDSYRNLYLLAGIWGDYRILGPGKDYDFELGLLRTFEEWGVQLAWGPCDSGVDLLGAGEDRLRAWGHVDLRRSMGDEPEDVPVTGLLRSMWDQLDLWGSFARLSGVVAIVPTVLCGRLLARRVGLRWSTLFDADRTAGASPVRVELEIVEAWGDPTRWIDWRSSGVIDHLRERVDVSSFMDRAVARPYPPSAIVHPFVAPLEVEQPFMPRQTEPFFAEVTLPVWSIDDAAWLVEAAADACHRAEIDDDVEIRVRSVE